MLVLISEVISNSNAVIRQDFRKLRFRRGGNLPQRSASLPSRRGEWPQIRGNPPRGDSCEVSESSD